MVEKIDDDYGLIPVLITARKDQRVVAGFVLWLLILVIWYYQGGRD
jgi:hypothetical protein